MSHRSHTNTRIVALARAGLWTLCALLLAGCQTAPLQLALWNPAQIVPETSDVTGLRVNAVYGKNARVAGLDVGGLNETSEPSAGLSAAGIAWSHDRFSGLQVGAGAYAREVRGAQLGAAVGFSDDVKGVQAGFWSYAGRLDGMQAGALISLAGESTGPKLLGRRMALQAGLANLVMQAGRGLQLAFFFNGAARFKGVQLGSVNFATELEGLQLGFLNFNFEGPIPIMVIANWNFPEKNDSSQDGPGTR